MGKVLNLYQGLVDCPALRALKRYRTMASAFREEEIREKLNNVWRHCWVSLRSNCVLTKLRTAAYGCLQSCTDEKEQAAHLGLLGPSCTKGSCTTSSPGLPRLAALRGSNPKPHGIAFSAQRAVHGIDCLMLQNLYIGDVCCHGVVLMVLLGLCNSKWPSWVGFLAILMDFSLLPASLGYLGLLANLTNISVFAASDSSFSTWYCWCGLKKGTEAPGNASDKVLLSKVKSLS